MQGLTPFESQALWATLIVALLVLAYAFFLRRQVAGRDKGSERMQEVWGFIQTGTTTYMNRQLQGVAIATVILAALLGANVFFFSEDSPQVAALWAVLGCMTGAAFAFLSGATGLQMAAQSNVRAAAAASKGYPLALQVIYRAGTVTALTTVGAGLLGSTIFFLLLGGAAAQGLIGFAAGGALVAILLRGSGGIYSQAAATGVRIADQSAEGLPDYDPGNPAVVAGLVGDNASDGGGMAADVFGSLELAFLVTFVLGAAIIGTSVGLQLLIFPLLLRGIGLLASVIGNAFVRTDEKRRNALGAMNQGLLIAAVLAILGFAAISFVYLTDPETGATDWRPLGASVSGVVLALLLNRLTEYFTATRYSPVKSVGRNSQSGAGGNLLTGMAAGSEAGMWAIVLLVLAVVPSTLLYATEPAMILYGVALTAVGMLSLAGNILAMNSAGAVAVHAARVGQMCGLDKNPRNVMEDLQAAGNTVKTITRGYATGAAVLALLALISFLQLATPDSITLLSGLLIGAALPLLILSLVFRSVVRATAELVNDVGQQWKQSSDTPDYGRAVSSATIAVQQDVAAVAVVVLLVLIPVAFLLGIGGVTGVLIGSTLVGLAQALLQANAGGALENARTYIEDGFYGGKNSAAHRAALTGATIGAPMRDVVDAVLVPLIKFAGLVGLLVVSTTLAVQPEGQPLAIGAIIATVVCLLLLLGIIALGRSEIEIDRQLIGKPVAKERS